MEQSSGATAHEHGSITYLLRVVSVATLGGLLFGYDTGVISGAIGFLQTHFDLSASMKGWAASSALLGCVFGVVLGGPVSDHFGRRVALLVAAVLFLVSAIGTAVPRTLVTFVIYRIVGGVGVGVASMTSPMYIAEISPARFRGRMVSINQFAIIFGMLVVYFVNYVIAGLGASVDANYAAGPIDPTQAWNVTTGWRWMFGSEALPALALLVLLLTVPESPRWLVSRNRREEATRVLSRVLGPEHAAREMTGIRAALAEEPASLSQLLSPGLRRVLWIGVLLAVLQQVTGINVFLYYAPEIFKGIASENIDAALLQTIVIGAVNLGFTVVAIWTADRLGRKPLMIIGSAGMGLCLAGLGLAASFGRTDAWILALILGYIACFALSVGPVTWVILSEIFPTKIRGRALAVATFCLWTANLIVSQTFPMMDENPWLVGKFNHGFPFFLYAVFCLALVTLVIAAVPETKGKTLEEIERQWTSSRRGRS
ncbi:MAG: sugar porter family MFS transporter [Phycisphaerales bacterium]